MSSVQPVERKSWRTAAGAMRLEFRSRTTGRRRRFMRPAPCFSPRGIVSQTRHRTKTRPAWGRQATIAGVIEARGQRRALARAYNLFSFLYGRAAAGLEREGGNRGLQRAAVEPGEGVLEGAGGEKRTARGRGPGPADAPGDAASRAGGAAGARRRAPVAFCRRELRPALGELPARPYSRRGDDAALERVPPRAARSLDYARDRRRAAGARQLQQEWRPECGLARVGRAADRVGTRLPDDADRAGAVSFRRLPPGPGRAVRARRRLRRSRARVRFRRLGFGDHHG